MLGDGDSGTNRHVVSAAAGRRWDWPLTIKVVINDLDGNLMPTYRTFLGVDTARECFEQIMAQSADAFVTHHVKSKSRQKILHLPHKTLQAADEFAKASNITLPPAVIRNIEKIIDESFRFYPGVKEALDRMHDAGTFSPIYTNSPDFFASGRLAVALDRAGVSADRFGAIWTRINDNHEPLSWMAKDPSPTKREIGERMIPYGYKKPHDAPIQEIVRITGAKPNEILLLGDSTSDLLSVYRSPQKPGAIFALQELGAQDICDRQRKVHKIISPEGEELGLDAVNSRIKTLNVEHDIIRLSGGYTTLLKLIHEGRIRFAAPDVTPQVHDRQLVAPDMGHGSLQRPARYATADGPAG